jgi:hypothetical protein
VNVADDNPVQSLGGTIGLHVDSVGWPSAIGVPEAAILDKQPVNVDDRYSLPVILVGVHICDADVGGVHGKDAIAARRFDAKTTD